MKTSTLLIIASLASVASLAGLAGCTTAIDDVDPSLTKEEAAAMYADGKSDGADYCAALNWYGDGICDPFCPLADHDCSDDECTVGADETCAGGESCAPGFCYFYCPAGDASCCEPASCQPDAGDFCPRALCGPGTVCDEETDSCVPAECPPVLCELYCEYGFETGDDGCAVCRCAGPDAPGCTDDSDCSETQWCRATASGGAECADYVGEGASCGGFTPEFALQRCAPDLTCRYDLSDSAPADAPGTCVAEVGCRRAGCSSQLCVPADSPPVASTCEWNPEYACFDDGVCERQDDGECGWTTTPEMQMCLDRLATDCRTDGCGAGSYCSYCWGNFQCIPDGAVC